MNIRLRVNNQISAPIVHLIDADGKSRGNVPGSEARLLAQEAGLDLIEVNPHLDPPLCKITDLGKYRYDLQKKERDSKKNQKTSELKEMRFRLKTDDHDRQTKLRKIAEFLGEGHKVQLTFVLRGREQMFIDLALGQLTALIEQLKTSYQIRLDKAPERLGNRVYAIVAKG